VPKRFVIVSNLKETINHRHSKTDPNDIRFTRSLVRDYFHCLFSAYILRIFDRTDATSASVFLRENVFVISRKSFFSPRPSLRRAGCASFRRTSTFGEHFHNRYNCIYLCVNMHYAPQQLSVGRPTKYFVGLRTENRNTIPPKRLESELLEGEQKNRQISGKRDLKSYLSISDEKKSCAFVSTTPRRRWINGEDVFVDAISEWSMYAFSYEPDIQYNTTCKFVQIEKKDKVLVVVVVVVAQRPNRETWSYPIPAM